MGASVNAICTCGYKVENLHIGGGMLTFKEFCAFPVFCKGCQKLVVMNLLERHPACPDCKSGNVLPYDHPDLIQVEGENVVVNWNVKKIGRNLQLTNGKYFCPSCREYNMTFQSGNIMWD